MPCSLQDPQVRIPHTPRTPYSGSTGSQPQGYQEFLAHPFWLAGWQSCGRPVFCSLGCAEVPGLYHIMTERESFNNNLGHKYTFKLLLILRQWELFFNFFCNIDRHKFFTQSVGTYHVPQTLSAMENNPLWTQDLQLAYYLFEHTAVHFILQDHSSFCRDQDQRHKWRHHVFKHSCILYHLRVGSIFCHSFRQVLLFLFNILIRRGNPL